MGDDNATLVIELKYKIELLQKDININKDEIQKLETKIQSLINSVDRIQESNWEIPGKSDRWSEELDKLLKTNSELKQLKEKRIWDIISKCITLVAGMFIKDVYEFWIAMH